MCVLSERFDMPPEVLDILRVLEESSWASVLQQDEVAAQMQSLVLSDSSSSGCIWEAIKQRICAAESSETTEADGHSAVTAGQRGWKVLYTMLYVAVRGTLPQYRKRGIPESVFWDTMNSFSRFVRESKERYGSYAFDRDFWTHRQLALRIFRIGELEYELGLADERVRTSCGLAAYADTDGETFDETYHKKRVVFLHIPSDVVLSTEAVQHSLKEWGAFTRRFYPEYEGVPLVCESWLLHPVLSEYLGEKSRISAFQKFFTITGITQDSRDWREWVFNCSALPVEQLPEDTRVRRIVKHVLLEKGEFGNGVGVIVNIRKETP